jgi:hypothetical protein
MLESCANKLGCWEIDGAASGSCIIMGFGLGYVESSSSTVRQSWLTKLCMLWKCFRYVLKGDSVVQSATSL